jgi:hypothetical protein
VWSNAVNTRQANYNICVIKSCKYKTVKTHILLFDCLVFTAFDHTYIIVWLSCIYDFWLHIFYCLTVLYLQLLITHILLFECLVFTAFDYTYFIVWLSCIFFFWSHIFYCLTVLYLLRQTIKYVWSKAVNTRQSNIEIFVIKRCKYKTVKQ